MSIQKAKTNMDKAMQHLQESLAKLRTGRANPSLVEDLMVEVYGSQQPLKGLAGINTPTPREIMISPWDKGSTADIVKAIEASDLGLNPNIAGEQIKLVLPELTAERREELTKLVNQAAEETRISLRNAREDFLKAIKTRVDNKEASEDELDKGKKDIQKLIDDLNSQIDELVEQKNEQIRTI